MTASFERDDEMLVTRDELRIAEELLDGRIPPWWVPPGYEQVAELLSVATMPLPSTDASEVARASQRIAAEVRATERTRVSAPLRATRRAARSAVVAAAVVIGISGTAAAAGNHLPDPLQSFLSSAASHVGISLPSPDDDAPPADAHHGTSDAQSPHGPPSSQPGKSAGDAGVDQRPACAGDPAADPAGCAGGVDGNGAEPPTTNEGTPRNDGNGSGTGDTGNDTGGPQPTTTPPPTTSTTVTHGNGNGNGGNGNGGNGNGQDHATTGSAPSTVPTLPPNAQK